MKRVLPILLLPLLAAAQTMKYPAAKKTDVSDTYHGTKVADPYRWLEDTDSTETAEWVAAENRVTQDYLSRIPHRGAIQERLTSLFNYERFSGVQRAGTQYLVRRNDGLQNQDVIYGADGIHGRERVLLDPNTLRADGTAAVGWHTPSRDGKLLAYAVADAGSDWTTWHVRDIATGKDLPDEVHWSKFEDAAWAPDQRGFYYLRFPEPKPGETLRGENVFAKIYLHRLGEPQTADKLIYERPDQKHWMFAPLVSDDGRYLLIVVNTGDFGRNLLFYQDLKERAPRTVELIGKLEA
jgi:prolyl oligopeptidase